MANQFDGAAGMDLAEDEIVKPVPKISDSKETSNKRERKLPANEMGEGHMELMMNPQFVAAYASDLDKYLRDTEKDKKPAAGVQSDEYHRDRAVLINWLVEVADEHRLLPHTLYLAVNYVDRYLSGNGMKRETLQLLGVACLLIASKYEQDVDELSDQTVKISKTDVLKMERSVLTFLEFKLTATTVLPFLKRYLLAAKGANQASSKHLEHLASYIAELSLLEYDMLQYDPSLVAASAIFLAKYLQSPSQKPWDLTLLRCTNYQPSGLSECVKALHDLVCDSQYPNLQAIKTKYSQAYYNQVAASKYPLAIPDDYFQNVSW